jgi:hypothetical protein
VLRQHLAFDAAELRFAARIENLRDGGLLGASISSSRSKKLQPSRCARWRPTVDLPLAMKPTR